MSQTTIISDNQCGDAYYTAKTTIVNDNNQFGFDGAEYSTSSSEVLAASSMLGTRSMPNFFGNYSLPTGF